MAFDMHSDLPPAAQARAHDGIEHLQAAARELIAAARAGLDVAEEVVNDPESAASVARTLSSVGELARYLSGLAAPGAPARGADRTHGDGQAEPPPADGSHRHATDEPARPTRVQRITVA